MPQGVSPGFQDRRALLRSLAPRYRQASSAQKTLLLDLFVEWTGYTRKYAIALLNHGQHDQQIIERRRLPQYGQGVQQALFLAWKAAHYVCAKRLLPSLSTLVTFLATARAPVPYGRRAPPVARHESFHGRTLLAYPTQTPPAWFVHHHSRFVEQDPDPAVRVLSVGRESPWLCGNGTGAPIVGTILMGSFSTP